MVAGEEVIKRPVGKAYGRSGRMRVMHVLTTILLVVGLGGCGEKPVEQSPHPAVAEAQTHFTYKGEPIPPFFLADFYGGPDASDFWLRGMGSRISSVIVAGLFVKGDSSYSGCKIDDRRKDGGFVSFNLPSDESDGSRETGWLAYRFVGTTPSGVTVLEQVGNTGGSGTIPGILFVRFEMESTDTTKGDKQDQLVMRFLGEQSWGDRVYRDVKLDGNSLWLGPTRTNMPGAKDFAEPERTIVLQ